MLNIFFHFICLAISARAAIWPVSDPNRTVIEQLTLDLEFSKDIASVLTEATLKSNCDGSILITSEGCRDYLDYMLEQLSEWGPPVILVSYQDFKTIGNSDLWTTFLAWKKRPCSIVFVCDILIPTTAEETEEDGETGNLESIIFQEDYEIGHLKLPKFIESSDQVLFLTDHVVDYFNGTESTNSLVSRNDIQAKILKQSGILLQILVENRTETDPETLMHVYSVCEFCGKSGKWQRRDMGFWQRNKTQFGKFFHVFKNFHKPSFNDSNIKIGYFNHPPHFSCFSAAVGMFDEMGESDIQPIDDLMTTCEGVEWEMVSQMQESLHFTISWVNLSNPYSGQGDTIAGDEASSNNISNVMISSFEEDKIDLAVGGLSLTPKRIRHLDFSSVFANDPIERLLILARSCTSYLHLLIFVVRKKSNLFAFGIWLAFRPEIWPLIVLLIIIISLLFHIIIYQYTLEFPKKKRWALSAYLHQSPRKPIHVSIWESLEITLQPLLGQPLSASQITHRPRRLLKLMLMLWWFSCLIIATLYNTSLITSLINPISPKEPEALQDLIDFGYRFKHAGKQGAFFELIKPVLDNIPGLDQDAPENSQLESNEEWNTVSLLKQISDRLVKDGSKTSQTIAYVIEESSVKGTKWDKNEIGFSQIKIIRERLFLTTYAWPTQRHAPFKKKINSALGRLNSAGLIDYWYDKFGHRDDKDRRSGKHRLREKLGQITLNMQVLQGAFIFILIFGYAFGVLALGIEHITKRYKFRFYTKKEISNIFRKIMNSIKKVYGKYFAAEHENLEQRRKKTIPRMRFRGAVRTVATFQKSKNIPYLK